MSNHLMIRKLSIRSLNWEIVPILDRSRNLEDIPSMGDQIIGTAGHALRVLDPTRAIREYLRGISYFYMPEGLETPEVRSESVDRARQTRLMGEENHRKEVSARKHRAYYNRSRLP